MTKRLKIGYFLKYTVNKCQVTSEMTHFIFDILGLRACIKEQNKKRWSLMTNQMICISNKAAK